MAAQAVRGFNVNQYLLAQRAGSAHRSRQPVLTFRDHHDRTILVAEADLMSKSVAEN
jgi:hypothetical protein